MCAREDDSRLTKGRPCTLPGVRARRERDQGRRVPQSPATEVGEPGCADAAPSLSPPRRGRRTQSASPGRGSRSDRRWYTHPSWGPRGEPGSGTRDFPGAANANRCAIIGDQAWSHMVHERTTDPRQLPGTGGRLGGAGGATHTRLRPDPVPQRERERAAAGTRSGREGDTNPPAVMQAPRMTARSRRDRTVRHAPSDVQRPRRHS